MEFLYIFVSLIITAITYMFFPLVFLAFAGKQDRKIANIVTIINSVCIYIVFASINYLSYGTFTANYIAAFIYYLINVSILTKRKPKNETVKTEMTKQQTKEDASKEDKKAEYMFTKENFNIQNLQNKNQLTESQKNLQFEEDFNSVHEDNCGTVIDETEDKDYSKENQVEVDIREVEYDQAVKQLFFKEFDKGYRNHKQKYQDYLTNLVDYLKTGTEKEYFIFDIQCINDKYKNLRRDGFEKFSFADIVILNIDMLAIRELLDAEKFVVAEKQYFEIINGEDYKKQFEIDQTQYCKLVVYCQNLFASITGLTIRLSGKVVR